MSATKPAMKVETGCFTTDYGVPNTCERGFKAADMRTHFTHTVLTWAEKVDVSDDDEFHDLLGLISSMSDRSLALAYIELAHPDLMTIPSRSTAQYRSQESKVSRWINGKAAPKKVETRRDVIKAGLDALKATLDGRTPGYLRDSVKPVLAANRPSADIIPIRPSSPGAETATS